MDLLTTVVHEEGHVLGLPDLNPAVYRDDIMTRTLPTGTRRFPRPGEAGRLPISLATRLSARWDGVYPSPVLAQGDESCHHRCIAAMSYAWVC
jgi:hypothetical protein